MSRLLAPVLTAADLPEPELRAAVLDGELQAVGPGFSPVSEFVGPRHRGAALVPHLHGRLIAEQHTAAWVLGALDGFPRPLRLCLDSAAVGKPLRGIGFVVREVVIADSELLTVGGARVTTPLRTILDLARYAETFGAVEQEIVTRLTKRNRIRLVDCIAAIEARRNLPQKHRALKRISDVLA